MESIAPEKERVPSFREVDPLRGGEWDQLIRAHSDASIFHASPWARVICETYGFRPFYIIGGAEETRSAACVMEVNSWITGRRGISLPFTDECKVLTGKCSAFNEVFEHSVGIGKARKWKTIEFRGIPAQSHAAGSGAFYCHQLNLEDSIQNLFASFHSSVRRAIRKAEKLGVQVVIRSDWESVRSYFDLHCVTRRKHGLPPQPLTFFRNIHRFIISAGFGFVALAIAQGKAVAGAIFFCFNNKASYKFGASNPSGELLRSNNLTIWSAVQHCVTLGCRSLNFGRTSLSNEGLRRYKLGWGTVEEILKYSRYHLEMGGFSQISDQSIGFHNRLFRALPSFISKPLGGLLYPHIA